MVVLDGATVNPGDNPWDSLRELGTLDVHDRTPAHLVVPRSLGAQILLTNKTPLDRATLEALPTVRLICVLATGINVVDLVAASQCGITVCNVPAYSDDSVAQHVFALLLQMTNAVGVHSAAVASGEWSHSADFSLCKAPLVELAGKTFGVIGYGRIGSRVGEIAQAFGMSVLGYNPSSRPAVPRQPFAWASVEQIFAACDIVSLHCPLTAQNKGFVNAQLLATMREGSILMNTARGDLIDEPALAKALALGRPAAAALDVLSKEPPPLNHPLVGNPRCLITPHVAWATLAARRRLMAIVRGNVDAFVRGIPHNVVAYPADI